MFAEIANKEIGLIDYEYLTNESKKRVVAFRRRAVIIGAYHWLRTLGDYGFYFNDISETT